MEPEASRARVAARAALDAPTELVPVGICPFLVAESRTYRLSSPAREHRCGAFVPPTSLAPTKQARLCLTASHVGCATYIASTSARAARLGAPAPGARSGRWSFARTTPVVEDVGGVRATLGALVSDRRTWPAVPGALLVALVGALAVAGNRGQGPLTAADSPRPDPTRGAAASASIVPAALATDSPVESSPRPGLTLPPTLVSTPRPAPSDRPYRTTYTVQRGDTLYRIAGRFGTTVTAITTLNRINDASRLRIGQVLLIP